MARRINRVGPNVFLQTPYLCALNYFSGPSKQGALTRDFKEKRKNKLKVDLLKHIKLKKLTPCIMDTEFESIFARLEHLFELRIGLIRPTVKRSKANISKARELEKSIKGIFELLGITRISPPHPKRNFHYLWSDCDPVLVNLLLDAYASQLKSASSAKLLERFPDLENMFENSLRNVVEGLVILRAFAGIAADLKPVKGIGESGRGGKFDSYFMDKIFELFRLCLPDASDKTIHELMEITFEIYGGKNIKLGKIEKYMHRKNAQTKIRKNVQFV